MKRTSLSAAKAHLSALVDEAEHKGRKTLILRHGRPSAAIVPVAVAVTPSSRRGRAFTLRLSAKQIRALLAGFGRARRGRSAVTDLLDGRR